ncbi:TetR/AcrR family transcriptional regulator [Xylanimonas allomyrinae]|uniref:TetR/AcrR family transcriptional regulator n=1 Tax=Xylanimonas allomyrinae TaxID=2509459 RepID=A0A4V0YEJ9_9MICO|nr:TetR/AcrR family transcriptional regulator [Xylanimonas allomyrinae]QAY64471.1 TetR/AcrR family transcriptional regulator [Xylanimonas allomyrinae]
MANPDGNTAHAAPVEPPEPFAPPAARDRRPAPTARVGRPRDQTRDGDILDAARAELAEHGYARMTMAGVAARAGAGKATVYRRWPSKAELVIDTIACTGHGAPRLDDVPDTGSLRGDLAALRGLKHKDEGVWEALAGIAAELQHSPQLAAVADERLVRPRVAVVRGLLARAAARGELAPGLDLDLIAQVPAAMVACRLVMGREPVDAAFLRSLADDVLVPLATGCPAARERPEDRPAR